MTNAIYNIVVIVNLTAQTVEWYNQSAEFIFCANVYDNLSI